MNSSVLAPVTAIYDLASEHTETIHRVDDPAAESFYKASRLLRKQWQQIGSQDVHILEATQKLTWFAYLVVTTPLPLGYLGLESICSPQELLSYLNRSLLSYPECKPVVEDVVRSFEQARSLEITELGLKVCELIESNDRVAIITGRPWLNALVQDHICSITDRDDIELLRASDLRRHEVFDTLIVTVPPNWIDSRIRNTVRSSQRDIVTLSLFKDSAEQKPVLPERWKPAVTVPYRSQTTQVHAEPEESPANLIIQDAIEGFEFSSFLNRDQNHTANANQIGNVAPLGDAEAFQLVNRSVVLLPAEGKTWTVEQEGNDFQVVQRKAEEIYPGDFVILRTQRDRELIAEIADKILGSNAVRLRQLQSEWKQTLTNKVNIWGTDRVSRDLSSLGLGTLATPLNVRRWTSDSFIRNQKYDSWLGIMCYLGFETQAENLWNEMGQINDAHRQAGHMISNVVKAQLQALSIKEIHDSMELPPMPELGEERLTLYLIQGRLGRVRDVRFTDMNRVIQW